ncbi:hypothetical protein PI124_g11793 [Phytophthora idaei]|nr:hypothetical protein PI124_g11793 [Phytophthora idaei]
MTSNIVSIMNRHTGMVLEQNLLNNSVQAFDSGLDEPTHQWYRIPVGGGYFVYKNVATGNVLDHWDIKEGAGNTVAMSDDVKDPKRQWFEVKLGDVFIGLRNRASRLFIDHYASREIRTSGEDSTYVERHWSLICHQPPCTTREIVTIKNSESDCLLEHSEEIQAVESRATSANQQWQRIPVGTEGYFVYKNVGTQMVLSLSQQGVEAKSDDGDDATQHWRECNLVGGLVALQNRAYACILRQANQGSIFAMNMNIRDANDLWSTKRAQPIQGTFYHDHKSQDSWMAQLESMPPVAGPVEDAPSQRESRNDDQGWIIHPSEVSFEPKPIAEGSFGTVYRAKWAQTTVVVKTIEITSPKDKMRFQREAKLWSKLRHSNIVPFYGANFTTEPFFIVSEFAENGTLNDYLAKGNVGLKAKWQLMHQVAVGLSYLHRKNIIHGDLKGDNIVLSKQGVAMLTGFSFLDSGSCSVLAMRDRLGALQWRAPEFIAILAERPTFASDIFSLGMCIIAAVNGAKYPWGNFDSAAVRKCYEERRIPVKRPHCMTEDQWELVGKMVAFEWKVRPKLDDVLEHLANFASTEERSIPVQFANKQKLPLNQQEID